MPRVKYKSILRLVIFIGLCYNCIYILLSGRNAGVERKKLIKINEAFERVLALVPAELHKYLSVNPRNTSGNATDRISPKNIIEIRRAIERYNDAQTIFNEDIFGPVKNDTIIIAIQVHTRLTYLRNLILSLAQARDINRTLIIFSHDYYDEEINNVVKSIDFTKVMQIFYPYSLQTHPNEFPGGGVEKNDSARNAKVERAVKKCNNTYRSDVHSNYREAKYTQIKHHWWWKANRIFNQLRCTATHTGMVVFLEEDHYLVEDFLHMVNLLRATADRSYPQCEILCLGRYLKTNQYHSKRDTRKRKRAVTEERRKKQSQGWKFQVYMHSIMQKVEITTWHSSMHNMGMVFNKTVWTSIMESEQQFCAYDDYNWDYSLLHLSQNRAQKEAFKVMLCTWPRIFHIGECGIHHEKFNCNLWTAIIKVLELVQPAYPYLFPTRVVATVTSGDAIYNKRLLKGNGGWGDLRDQELCTNMTKVSRQKQ